jgi:hypothetical protein
MNNSDVFCEKLFSVLPPSELLSLLRTKAKDAIEDDDLIMTGQITEVMQMIKDALNESVERSDPKDEQEEADRNADSRSIYDWFKSQYSIDVPTVWDRNKDFILDSLPLRFRCQDLYPVVSVILKNLDIPDSDIANLRFGCRVSAKRGRFLPTLVSRLSDHGKKKDTNWWTREEIDGVHYLVKVDQYQTITLLSQPNGLYAGMQIGA